MLNGQESNVANVLPDQHVNSDCKFKIVMETPEFVAFLGFVELLGKTCWFWDKRREKGALMLVLMLWSRCVNMFGVSFVFGNLSFKVCVFKVAPAVS